MATTFSNAFNKSNVVPDPSGCSVTILNLVTIKGICSGTEHVGERVEYSKRLHSMPEAACTVKN